VRLADPRRLLGRNALLPSSSGGGAAVVVGVTMELVLDDGEGAAALDAMEARLRAELTTLGVAVGLPTGGLVVRRHKTGATVGLPAALDALRTAVDVLEWAAVLAGAVPDADVPPVDADELARRLRDEKNPALVALLQEAARRDVPALLYDDGVSLGHGERSRTWPTGTIPAVDDVPWSDLGRVPVALVTGTNGKTTTTRFLAGMMRAAGVVVGATSTDGVVVGTEQKESGDWSGPGGARAVLRDPRVQMAALETARGGLLRRGLAVEGADVAIVTNVSDDHLGDYGVHDTAAMADVKLLIAHGVRRDGRVVLNANDALLVARAPAIAAPVVYFAIDEHHPVVAAHVQAGGSACVVRDGVITLVDGRVSTLVLAVDDVPLCFGGAAAHNVENALAATAAGHALGLPIDALQAGLRSLRANNDDLHGRSLVREHEGVRVLLDFAHNPAGVTAALRFVLQLRARDAKPGRLIVLTGAAGDRADEELRGVSAAIAAARPDRVIVRELVKYLRGKPVGSVPARIREHLVAHGVDAAVIDFASDDIAGLVAALDDAHVGDTIAMLIHIDGPGVAALLSARGWG
jgi:UDP-N-acetylmuramyl tripeptide synthase